MSKLMPKPDLVSHILETFRDTLLHDEAFDSEEVDAIDRQLRKKYPPGNKKLDEILTTSKKPKT